MIPLNSSKNQSKIIIMVIMHMSIISNLEKKFISIKLERQGSYDFCITSVTNYHK